MVACLLGTIAWILLLLIARFTLDAVTVVPSAVAATPFHYSPEPEEVFRPLPAVVADGDGATPSPTAQPTVTPSGEVRAASTSAPLARGPGIRVALTWYCLAGRSRCTRHYPDGPGQQLYAAASPDLLAIGWRGTFVRVAYGGSSVIVRVIDCSCQARRSLDLYSDAFAALAPLGLGRINGTATVLR
jgi:hypothetical protein